MNIRAIPVAAALCAAIAADSLLASPRKPVELKQPAARAPRGAKPSRPATPADATDFYYFNGERIPLRRSKSEVVIRVKGNASGQARDVVSQGRRFRIVPASDQLHGNPNVEAVAGVFEDPRSGTKMLATDEIVVKLRAGGTRQDLIARAEALGLRLDRAMRGTKDEFVLRLADPKKDDVLEKARILYESGAFTFAEPHFLRQYKKHALPNDARFGQQWHLNNTGQGGGTSGADVDAVTAWNSQTGSSSIVIAVVDDGVEKAHEDLAANIFINPGETAGNGIDDDHNGYIDDVSGWDFSNDDNNADPFDVEDGHGTAVAGVAAARGDNLLGVAGICQTCKILPVKIFSPDYAGDVATADALRYAASFAHVVNNSWGGGAPSAMLQSAIQSGTTDGRGGKGSAVMFSTGNDAGGNFLVSSPAMPPGTHRFRWTYSKDVSLSDGEDSAWLSWVIFPGEPLVNFESGLPAGFTTGGTSSWSVVTDALHSDEGRCFVKAAKAGALGNDQSNYIEVVKTLGAGVFHSYQWVSSEFDFDGLTLDIDFGNNGTIDLTTDLMSGIPPIVPGVAYPAAHPESIAVGSSTNFDCRSDYSQFGTELAFVAPSSGGPLNLGIETTDRTGALGYDSADYTLASGESGFGGTSSASPLAAGVAGLLLSRNPSLTLAQLTNAMKNTADKVGSEPYVAGRNDRYGYGRLNANAALLSIASCATVSVTPVLLPGAQTNNVYSQPFTASGGVAPYTYAVTVGSLPAGLTLSAAGVLSGTPTALGTFDFSVQATDANGCTGFRAVNLVVTVGTAPPPGRSLYIVTPCRVIDSRASSPLAHLGTRDIQFTGACGIPSSATAIVANITAINPITTGFLALYPTGTTWPGTSTMNYRFGKTRANNAVLPLSNLGKVTILNNGSTQHFIVDVTGYFE